MTSMRRRLPLSLRLAWWIVGGAWLAAAQAQDEAPLSLREVAAGVFVHHGAQEDWLPGNGGNVSNLGVVLGQRCVAVVDTGGSPAIGLRLRRAIGLITPLPVCYVINTHAHPDHVLGNSAFVNVGAAAGDVPVFVAHAKFAAALSGRSRYYLNSLRRDFGQAAGPELIVLPTRAVEEPMDLDLGGRILHLQAWPTAHTDNDLSVYDRGSGTLFSGDLVFIGHMPVVDGSLRGWLKVMDELGRLGATRIVPGHGPVSDDPAAAMAPQARYLGALLTETRAAIKAGRTIRQAVETVGQDAARPWLLGEVFHRRNVTAAFAELEWEE